MSSVVISGNTSGTVTLDAPAIAGSTTITLPSTSGTMALTSDIPAAGGLTLLGTVATTSGASVSLGSLALTGYKQLMCVFQGVSHTDANNQTILIGTSTSDDVNAFNGTDAEWVSSDFLFGAITIDLTNGSFWTVAAAAAASSSSAALGSAGGGDCTITTASTTISFAMSAGSFDAGSILVYGMK